MAGWFCSINFMKKPLSNLQRLKSPLEIPGE
jgi:hypothetical protein